MCCIYMQHSLVPWAKQYLLSYAGYHTDETGKWEQ